MSAKVSQEELNKIREQIKSLKDKLKIEQNVFRIKGGLITDEVLEKMSVKELRGLVAKHKLFKGISKLKKDVIIDKIKKSDWYNGQQAPPLPPKKKKKKKTQSPPDAPPIAPPAPQPPTAPPIAPPAPKPPDAPPIAPPAPPPPKVKETEKLMELEDDVNLEKPKLERQKAEVLKETRAEKRKRLLAELDEIKSDSDSDEDHPLVSKKENDKKQMDVGHTIVNVYCGGNSHPEYPVPQSVVRQALNAQNLPPPQQQQVSEFLRQEAQQTPINQPVANPPVKNLNNIRDRFNKPDAPKSEVRKFKPVKTTPPLQKPILPTKPKPSSNFDDDSDEEETAEERVKRERAEEIAREVGASKGKGRTDKFKNKLEGILGQRLAKPPS